MSCDVPIISGNTTSLPEVVGDAALLCSPTDHQLVAEYMTKISEDDQLRNNLINKGRIQKEKFSWDISASNLWKSIEKAANKKGI
jgi:glycosyltransferase involved in cell wall biosynthesis